MLKGWEREHLLREVDGDVYVTSTWIEMRPAQLMVFQSSHIT